jgi:hypothetical protein
MGQDSNRSVRRIINHSCGFGEVTREFGARIPALRRAEPPALALVSCVTTSCRSRAADPTQSRTYSGRRSAMPGKTGGSGRLAVADLTGALHRSISRQGNIDLRYSPTELPLRKTIPCSSHQGSKLMYRFGGKLTGKRATRGVAALPSRRPRQTWRINIFRH